MAVQVGYLARLSKDHYMTMEQSIHATNTQKHSVNVNRRIKSIWSSASSPEPGRSPPRVRGIRRIGASPSAVRNRGRRVADPSAGPGGGRGDGVAGQRSATRRAVRPGGRGRTAMGWEDAGGSDRQSAGIHCEICKLRPVDWTGHWPLLASSPCWKAFSDRRRASDSADEPLGGSQQAHAPHVPNLSLVRCPQF